VIKGLKKLLIGSPLPSWEYKHQRLPKILALPVFSSDALSSVAYATEEILLILITAGSFALIYSIPIAMIILLLLWMLIISYRQTIEAYPNGGGAYIVSKENLGVIPGLTAAGALLLDYILTVSVSVAAGVAAVTSAFPQLHSYKVAIGIFVIVIITLINLKGVKESGFVFSVPTYMFIISFFIMLIIGFYRFFTGGIPEPTFPEMSVVSGLTLFLLLRAFSSGCAALTGVEAISNGVPAFRKPESKNAKTTLTIMAGILTLLFFGITFLSHQYGIIPSHDRTVVSMLAENIFGRGIFFYIIQAFTMLILFLAANTSYADFPRLCFFLAKDRFLPNQFKQLGDRLVFSNGIIFLGMAASGLIIMFHGDVHSLIPLYAVGVFTSFTLSQTGMVIRSRRKKGKNWQRKAMINGVGAVMTGLALLVIGTTKFIYGAWIIIILIPITIIIFLKINSHYKDVASQLSISGIKPPLTLKQEKHLMVVLTPTLHKGIIDAFEFAKSFCNNIVAVHINLSGSETEELLAKWKKYKPDIKLVVLESPYRRVKAPLMQYLDRLEAKDKDLKVTVVIPEFVPVRWWHYLLHNQTALSLKTAIHFRKRTSYISVQYHFSK
jgi:amino acid transporter